MVVLSGFLSQGRFILLFGFLAVFMGNFGQSFFLGSYGAAIQQQLSLSASSYGLIYSIATLLAGSSLMFVGGYIDTLPLARFTLMAAIGLTCAAVLFTFANSFIVLVVAFYLVRLCGQGMLPHTGITVMARCFSNNRGKAISIAASGVPVGEIFLPIVATVLIAWVGWHNSWLFIAGFTVLFFVPMFHFLLQRARSDGFEIDPAQLTNDEKKVTKTTSARLLVLADRRFWLFLPALIAAPFLVTGIFIHQDFVMQQRQWSREVFALGFVAYGIVHWISSIAAGVAVDRYTATRLLAIYNLPLLLAMIAIFLLRGDYLVFLVLSLLGVSIGSTGPIVGSLWAEIYGTASLGTIRSMATSFGVWSTSLSPVLFGVLIDRGISLSQLSLALAVFVFLACMLAAVSYRARSVTVN